MVRFHQLLIRGKRALKTCQAPAERPLQQSLAQHVPKVRLAVPKRKRGGADDAPRASLACSLAHEEACARFDSQPHAFFKQPGERGRVALAGGVRANSCGRVRRRATQQQRASASVSRSWKMEAYAALSSKVRA